MVASNEYQNILKTVSGWSLEDRVNLINELVGGMRGKASSMPQIDELVGIARGSGPAPTDEQVKKWIEEHRMEKYG